MMDQFLEEVVTKRNRGVQTAAYIMANLMMVLLGVTAFLYFTSITTVLAQSGMGVEFFITIGMFVVFGAGAVFAFLYRDRVKTEYEYTFTNGTLDFAAVYNNNKRKALGTMNLKNIKACGKVASGSFNRYINMQGLKRSNWFVNREADLFYIYFEKDNSKRIIIMEPNEEMEKLIRGAVPQGAYQVN